MNKIQIFKEEMKRAWHIQGFNAYPIFLNAAAHSGLTMKKELGFGYTKFIFNYKNGYGEMWYLASDLPRIYKIIKTKLKHDPNYLKKVKKRYEDIYKKNEKLFSTIDKTNLKKIPEKFLIDLLKKCSLAATDGVGIAHVLDPIGPEIEKEFKAKLSKSISKNKELSHVWSVLTTPEKLSYVAQEEKELAEIFSVTDFDTHAKKYFWVRNSFAGGKNLSIRDFKKRAKQIKNKKNLKNDVRSEKKTLVKKYRLDNQAREMVDIINFSAIWQDERKAKAMKSVAYLAKVIKEVSRRSRIDENSLYYLGFSDIAPLVSLKDISKMRSELQKRKKGVFVLMQLNKETNLVGKDYVTILRNRRIGLEEETTNELHGSIASSGTASGKVKICLGVSAIEKVEKGDIIVTSMTRPEFMPALKKAAGIVTDEGGITCHAAIIARELGIPAVIGAKIATKVLTDGDLVEVRANHGVVKIIKKSA